MSRKRRGSDNPLEPEGKMIRRKKPVFASPVCPQACPEDAHLKGDSQNARRPGFFKEIASHWESAPADLGLGDKSASGRRHTLGLKTVFMLSSWGTQAAHQSPGLNEEELLEASEVGDLTKVKALLSSPGQVNVNCVDILGRTPLMIATERDNLQLMDLLITKSSKKNLDTVLLHAINQGKEMTATMILRHPTYVKYHKVQLNRLGTNISILDGDFPMTSNFYLDTTPIILASQKNLFAVVKLLLLRGERIPRPHAACCSCTMCDRRMKRDRLRFAHRRLNTYRGLASESYITLSSQDPFAEAFDLSQEVTNLSHTEKYFKEEYLTLARQLGKYVVRLLNEIRGSHELDLVLDKVDGDEQKEFEPLARIRRAIHIGMKKFVTHPSCQMKLTELWYLGCRELQRSNWLKRIFFFVVFMPVYPVMAFLFLFIPNAKFLQVLRTPAIRFTAEAYSFMIFIVAIAGWSLNYDPGSTVALDFHGHNVSHLFRKLGNDYITREYRLDGFEIIIFVWTVGLLWMKCQDLLRRGLVQHLSTVYNVLDMVIIALYMTSFTLGYVVVIKCSEGLQYFRTRAEGFEELSQLNQTAMLHFYWITPDRYMWDTWDPEHLSEASFAIANVLTFSRISYLLAANETLGPLQISLGRMTYDILKFTVLFLIILLAFMVGIDNLLWHYESSLRAQVQLKPHDDMEAGKHFGNVEKTFRSVFWVTFGLVEYDIIDMHPYTNYITQNLAYILLGAYMVSVGLVMLNMLIAMMSRSFDQIAQDGDIEFKFARSKLYLEYIEGGSPLAVPLNMLPTTATISKLLQRLPIISKLRPKKPDSSQDDASDDAKTPPYRRYKKSSSKAISAEVQYLAYQDAIKKIVDRFISEITQKDDDDTDKQNTIEVVKQEVKSLQESVNSRHSGARADDNGDVKQCVVRLTAAIDRFIIMQSETSKLLERITKSFTESSIDVADTKRHSSNI